MHEEVWFETSITWCLCLNHNIHINWTKNKQFSPHIIPITTEYFSCKLSLLYHHHLLAFPFFFLSSPLWNQEESQQLLENSTWVLSWLTWSPSKSREERWYLRSECHLQPPFLNWSRKLKRIWTWKWQGKPSCSSRLISTTKTPLRIMAFIAWHLFVFLSRRTRTRSFSSTWSRGLGQQPTSGWKNHTRLQTWNRSFKGFGALKRKILLSLAFLRRWRMIIFSILITSTRALKFLQKLLSTTPMELPGWSELKNFFCPESEKPAFIIC